MNGIEVNLSCPIHQKNMELIQTDETIEERTFALAKSAFSTELKTEKVKMWKLKFKCKNGCIFETVVEKGE